VKIVTVNLPEAYIKTIEGLVGEDGLYPSRSELIRVATRDFLIKEIAIAKNFPKFQEASNHIVPEPLKNDELIVRVPVERTVGLETIKEYRTFTIVQKVR
jgi:Arc/MetJ-type ribon-helix-helix transcriptional regulator